MEFSVPIKIVLRKAKCSFVWTWTEGTLNKCWVRLARHHNMVRPCVKEGGNLHHVK
jgi:hypothetical protein